MCRGRIQGSYPIYLPPDTLLTERIVHDKHVLSLHGGVGLTMSFVRQQYWVPRLRQLTKRVIRGCYGCKKFQVTAFSNPPVGNLPTDRTEGSTPFEVVGLDFAGPIGYKLKTKKEGKAYILLFACSLTKAVPWSCCQTKQLRSSLSISNGSSRGEAAAGRFIRITGEPFVSAAEWLNGW